MASRQHGVLDEDAGVARVVRYADELEFNGLPLDVSNVITFLSPNQGIVYAGRRSVGVALRLDQAAERLRPPKSPRATSSRQPTPNRCRPKSWASWPPPGRTPAASRRSVRSTAPVEWKEFQSDPSKLQLVESRKYQALEMARLLDIPGYLLGIDQSGMTYQNAQQSRQDPTCSGRGPSCTRSKSACQ
jgi:hypothetical protein